MPRTRSVRLSFSLALLGLLAVVLVIGLQHDRKVSSAGPDIFVLTDADLMADFNQVFPAPATPPGVTAEQAYNAVAKYRPVRAGTPAGVRYILYTGLGATDKAAWVVRVEVTPQLEPCGAGYLEDGSFNLCFLEEEDVLVDAQSGTVAAGESSMSFGPRVNAATYGALLEEGKRIGLDAVWAKYKPEWLRKGLIRACSPGSTRTCSGAPNTGNLWVPDR